MLECRGLCRDSVLKKIIKFIKLQGKCRMFFQLQLYLISTYLKLSNQRNMDVNKMYILFFKLNKATVFKEY